MLLIGGFDELICLDNLQFEPFPYQVKAAQAALRRFRGRGMLCDEVGLGKTIEAGLVIKEYLMRQMAERILILTPPGLVQQWREELAQKFGLRDFVTNTDEAFRAAGDDAWAKFPRVIASIAAARHTGNRAIITSLIGEMEMILGYLTQEQDFEEMLLEVWLNSADETGLENNMTELGDRLLAARETMRRIQTFDETLFGEDFTA